MKILLLSPNQIERYNSGHERFRQDLKCCNNVIYYGNGFPGYDPNLNVSDILQKCSNVDCILTYGLRYTDQFEGLGDITIPKVHILVDYFPPHPAGYKGSWERQHVFFEKNKFDLFFVRQRRQLDDLKKNNIHTPAFWLPFSVNIKFFKNYHLDKAYDVITSSTLRQEVYPNRDKVNNLVKKMKLRIMKKRVTHSKYVNAINQSKIAIISKNIFSSPNMKYTEFTSCGTFILADKPEDFEELGFKDGEHLVLYKDLNELRKKIRYYLKHDKEREEIALNGMKFVRENHNNKIRAQQFTDIIKNYLGK